MNPSKILREEDIDNGEWRDKPLVDDAVGICEVCFSDVVGPGTVCGKCKETFRVETK